MMHFESLGSAEKLLLFFIVGHLGLLLHYFKLFAKAQTQCSAYEYFFKVNVRASALTYVTFLGALVTILFTIGDEGFKANLLSAFTSGYAINSAFNSADETASAAGVDSTTTESTTV